MLSTNLPLSSTTLHVESIAYNCFSLFRLHTLFLHFCELKQVGHCPQNQTYFRPKKHKIKQNKRPNNKSNEETQTLIIFLTLVALRQTTWAQTVNTYYISENGDTQNVTATVLTKSTDVNGAGWYIVSSTVSMGYFSPTGTINIILADGAEMTVADNTNIFFTSSHPLAIYGKSACTGRLTAPVTTSPSMPVAASPSAAASSTPPVPIQCTETAPFMPTKMPSPSTAGR